MRVKSTPPMWTMRRRRRPENGANSGPLLKPSRRRLRVKSTPLRVKSTLPKLVALSARRALAARDRTPSMEVCRAGARSPRSAPPSIVAASYRLRPSCAGRSRAPETTRRARECAWDHRGLETVTCQPAAGKAAPGQVVPALALCRNTGGQCSKAGLASPARQPLICLLGAVVVLLTLA